MTVMFLRRGVGPAGREAGGRRGSLYFLLYFLKHELCKRITIQKYFLRKI